MEFTTKPIFEISDSIGLAPCYGEFESKEEAVDFYLAHLEANGVPQPEVVWIVKRWHSEDHLQSINEAKNCLLLLLSNGLSQQLSMMKISNGPAKIKEELEALLNCYDLTYDFFLHNKSEVFYVKTKEYYTMNVKF